MSERRAKPLAGLRVLDLTRLLPGPVATLHLADLGADVIKIEDTGPGDYARSMGARQGETSAFFRLINRNKRALRLDLKKAEGVAVFQRLTLSADVVIEGFRPGVMDKLGIGYTALSALNPRLVFCSISGYGQTGPYAQRAGHDINYIGYAGVLDQIGEAGRAPAVPNFQIGDLLGGALTPLVGLLAAVIDARATGRGRQVDVAMTDAVLAHAIFPLTGMLARRAPPPRGADLLSGGVPCYGVYATADGRYMAVGALEWKFWELLCDTLGRPDLKPFHLAFGEKGEKARAELAAVFASQPQRHWIAKFDDVDCCVTPVLTINEALDNEQLQARGMIVEADGLPQFAPPYKLSDYAFSVDRSAPAAGQDGEDILREAGYDSAAVAALRAQGII
ncbi:MAG: CoA transferase [Rhodocyclaceae bacterium]|nr:CoA transferase [Rhodocyclaceae bacterium]MBX3676302.1 CoA transferase [Rhodocyclaceae bacterium]MCB1891400.1 CoA transferase [Rhodocyclaceae bacterium]MCP5297284.1 CoA transferase [Zoogloeaceae bacterium]MCW5595925.1 CoA transferase [Rhodocyclaceae bacterium]